MLAEHRQRVMPLLAKIAVVLFIPLAIHNLWIGYYPLAAAIVMVQIMLGGNIWAMRGGGKPMFHHALIALPTAFGVAYALSSHGLYGAFWAYPVVLYAHFVLPRLVALLSSAALLSGATAIIFFTLSHAVAVRFAVSLLLTILIIQVVLQVLGDLQRQLLEKTITDPLTGAFNRRHMDNSIDEAIKRCGRSEAPVTLLIIDIDHFKDINDLYGHECGDAVLCKMVNLIRARARTVDRLFRMGGEEFLLLLGDTRLADGLMVGEAVRRAVTDATWPEDHRVTVSIGVAEFVAGEPHDAWMKRADLSLYRAKHGGRNRVVG